jgi:L-lactate dehydrogenase
LTMAEFSGIQGISLTEEQRLQIDENVRRAAYHIIEGKGATYYGIGSAVARIVDVLLHDQRAILTICCRISGVPDCDGVTLSLPHIVAGEGALVPIPLPLTPDERAALRRSADILREAIESLEEAHE